LYRGFNPDYANRGYHLTVYFNLYDPGCAVWQDCTSESRTPHFWLQQTGVSYTVHNEWQAQTDTATFTGTASVVRNLDLSQTSPSGVVYANQFYLMVNACGGSTHNQCGPWDGPANLKGGPIGVTYSDVILEIFGPDPPDGGVNPDAGVVVDGATGGDGGTAADGGTSPDGGSTRDANLTTDGGPGSDGDGVKGGCGCRSAPFAGPAPLLVLFLLVWLFRGRRRTG
jgi:MYXO-CTERM domain-containing protein